MTSNLVTGAVAVIAVLVAAYVETHGGDPTPYIGVATGALGYSAGNTVAQFKNGTRTPKS